MSFKFATPTQLEDAKASLRWEIAEELNEMKQMIREQERQLKEQEAAIVVLTSDSIAALYLIRELQDKIDGR